jgi:hypothetical protein
VGKRIARVEKCGQRCIVIPVQGVACKADGGGKGGGHTVEAVLLGRHDGWGRGCRYDLNYKILRDIISVLVKERIAFIPVFQVDIKPFTRLAGGGYGNDISECVGVGR